MPIPTQWNNVQPNFSGSGQSMADASQSYARVGDVGNQYLLNLRQSAKDKQEETRYQTEQQYKIGRDVVADKDNADRLKLLQSQDVRAQAAEGRQGTDFARKLLGEQRLAEYNARLSGGLARGEMTDQQAAKVNAQVEQLAAQGVSPDQMAGKLGKLLEFQAPKTARDKAAYIQQAGFNSPDYNAEPLLRMQEAKAKPFLEQAADEDRYAQQLSLEKMRQAQENARLNKKLAADKEATKAKPTPVMMSKILPDGRVQEIPIYTPEQATAYGAQGFMLGKVEGGYKPTNTYKDGTSKIDLHAVGGGSLLGGTSGADLVTLSKRMKNEFKKVPQEAIDAEIQNLSQGLFSDAVDLDSLRKNLKAYQ